MIPKLSLNFKFDKTTDMNFDTLFDKMRYHKIIYVEAIITGIDTLVELKKFDAIFKKMRITRCIDYTIWLDVGNDPFKAISIAKEASLTNRLIMGATTGFDIDSVPYGFNYTMNLQYPRFDDLCKMTDDQAIINTPKALELAHCPEGMRRGLQRVFDDCVKLYYHGPQEPDESEISTASVQELE